jgi:hypothetical protein
MKNLSLADIRKRSLKIRKSHHELERIRHGNEWTVEEDALAFLTDARLVGRYTISKEGRCPKADTNIEFEDK